VTAEEDRIHLRQTQAIALRVKGYSFREIAKELGVSVGQAHHDVRAAMAEFDDQAAADVELERKTQSRRLEQAFRTISAVLDGQVFNEDGEIDHELRLKAIDRLVKLEERRAKLLGLDAPAKQELVGSIDIGDVTPAKAKAVMKELFDSVAAPGAEDAGTDEP
jgi:hypothetical protein